MSEQAGFGESFSTQNEVDMCENLFGLPYIDSPSSVDSGMARSPFSCDSSSPSSPSSPNLPNIPEEEFQNIAPLTESEDDRHPSNVKNGKLLQDKPQTPRFTEKTVKKLLELLVAAKTTDERSLLSNLLTTLVTNSLKKDETPSTLPGNVKKNKHELSLLTLGKKRPSSPYSNEVPCKVMKTVDPVKPSIVMVEQPEQNYRARYESEGCRGPVHGSSELTFPTFQVKGYNEPLWVTVYLATSNGTPHFHLLCGPGSTKLPCQNTTLLDGVGAIQVLVGPETEMTAVLDCISLKRRRNFEADKELRRRGLNPVDWKSERKEACFVMTAEIPGYPSQTITCKSKVFQCTAPPGNPEIWWMRPVQGYVTGGEEIGIIGKKFLKGFQVRFYGELPNGEMWQAYGEIDRSKTNTGACVVKSPPLKDPITSPLTVNVEISGDLSNNYTSSDSASFTYVPLGKPSEAKDGTMSLDVFEETLELSEILREIAQMSPESTHVLDMGIDALSKEWKEISEAIAQLHIDGRISDSQNKELRFLVSQHDTILLEAFRSTKQSVSDSEFLPVFCQYVAGLTTISISAS
ncbi:uncharacterized protein LOC114523322 [Dendronephthya gigantea]|uniref:uncharacterized protein LOC114523322 n=1 Tax=Dendronephthya gigantea TaxID=151771 RepID=UPI00106C7791|nr:uncharacterized protein LOC114523322 [Dendronephthya gigantea]